MDERRARSIEPFVANRKDAPIEDGGNAAPAGVFESCRDARAGVGGGPGEENDVGRSGGDFGIGDARAGGYTHFCSDKFEEFGDPGRRADAGFGPGFGVDAERRRVAQKGSRANGDAFEGGTHSSDEKARLRNFGGDSAESEDVGFNVGEFAGIESEKNERLAQDLFYGFGSEGDGADNMSGTQTGDFIDVEFPTIADRGPAADTGDVTAPFADADEFAANANR